MPLGLLEKKMFVESDLVFVLCDPHPTFHYKLFFHQGRDCPQNAANHWHAGLVGLSEVIVEGQLCLLACCKGGGQKVKQRHRNWICKSQISCLMPKS